MKIIDYVFILSLFIILIGKLLCIYNLIYLSAMHLNILKF